MKVWKKPKRVQMEVIDIVQAEREDEEEDEDDDDDEIEKSLITRKKRCSNIHHLLEGLYSAGNIKKSFFFSQMNGYFFQSVLHFQLSAKINVLTRFAQTCQRHPAIISCT